jgi:hypothetical protein
MGGTAFRDGECADHYAMYVKRSSPVSASFDFVAPRGLSACTAIPRGCLATLQPTSRDNLESLQIL